MSDANLVTSRHYRRQVSKLFQQMELQLPVKLPDSVATGNDYGGVLRSGNACLETRLPINSKVFQVAKLDV